MVFGVTNENLFTDGKYRLEGKLMREASKIFESKQNHKFDVICASSVLCTGKII